MLPNWAVLYKIALGKMYHSTTQPAKLRPSRSQKSQGSVSVVQGRANRWYVVGYSSPPRSRPWTMARYSHESKPCNVAIGFWRHSIPFFVSLLYFFQGLPRLPTSFFFSPMVPDAKLTFSKKCECTVISPLRNVGEFQDGNKRAIHNARRKVR